MQITSADAAIALQPADGLKVSTTAGTVVLNGAKIGETALAFHAYKASDAKNVRFWVDTPRTTSSGAVTPTRVDTAPQYDVKLEGLKLGPHYVLSEIVMDNGRRFAARADFTVVAPATPTTTTTTTAPAPTTTTTTAPAPTTTTTTPPVTPPVTANGRLGLHVSTGELALWRQRAVTGPYKVAGDAVRNSPGDWARIVGSKDKFMADPGRFAWAGPTHDYPNPIRSDDTWPRQDLAGVPGQRDGAGAAEPVRDAAYYAMVVGAGQVPGATISAAERDRILASVKGATLQMVRSKYNDFGNTQRWNPGNFGTGFHPNFQIARWLTIVTFTYDYAQVANPAVWSAAEKSEFINWMNSASNWFTPKIDARRDGMFNADGSPTAAASEANGDAFWSGGPRAEKVHTRIDNHVPRLAQVPVLAGLLAELEQKRSGVSTLGAARIDQLVDYGRRSVQDYLVAEFIAQAPGTGGGLTSGSGNMYRWGDPPPINGWKYAMEHLGRNLLLADHIARSGEVSIYDQATTRGTKVSAGSLPVDGVTNGGPKTLRGAVRQMLSYVDEDSGPVRYGCNGCSDQAHRIDSRDDINNIYRANEWEVLQANVYFQDDYVKSIYLRTQPGTPDLPAQPDGAHGWIQGGSDGAYPGANFMFAQVEGKVWPYPER